MTDRSIEITMMLERDGDFWIGTAKEIPVADFGRTQAEAYARTSDAIVAWIRANVTVGKIDEVAAHYGLTIEDVEPEDAGEAQPPPTFSHRYLVPA